MSSNVSKLIKAIKPICQICHSSPLDSLLFRCFSSKVDAAAHSESTDKLGPSLKLIVRSVLHEVELSKELKFQDVVVERLKLIIVEIFLLVGPLSEPSFELLTTTSDAGFLLGVAVLLLDISNDGIGHVFVELQEGQDASINVVLL